MTQTPSQLIQQFLRSIGQECALYQRLLSLQKEQHALYVRFDAQVLQDNIQQQSGLLKQLKQAAQHRTFCLQQLNLTNNAQGVSKLLNALPPALQQQATKQWQTLAQLVTQCQQYNQRNGQTSATFHEMIEELIQPRGDTYQEQW